MSVPVDFRTDVRDWVALDDKLSKAKKVIEKVKAKKNDISGNIVKFMKRNRLEKKEIKISNSRLKCGKCTKTTPLTKKFITECLTEFLRDAHEAKEAVKLMYTPKEKIKICLEYFFEDEEKAEEATEYIFSRRERTVSTTLRRKIQRTPVDVEEGPISENVQRAMETPHDTEVSSDDDYEEGSESD